MRIDFITLFPEVFAPMFTSIPGKAQEKGLLELHVHWLREWGIGKQRQVDDSPFGGGPGMVMKPEPFFECLDTLPRDPKPLVVYPTPQGVPFRQSHALRLASCSHIVFLCGHYEGIDQRVRDALVDEEYSLGDYVLSSGELSSMVIADAIIRLIPGVIKAESYQQDSFFEGGGLDHPHYTKPSSYRDMNVPEVLLSGHHEKIECWRAEQARERTRERRPDLVDNN